MNHHFNASTSQVTGIKMSIGEEKRRREQGTERGRRGVEREVVEREVEERVRERGKERVTG